MSGEPSDEDIVRWLEDRNWRPSLAEMAQYFKISDTEVTAAMFRTVRQWVEKERAK